MDVIFYFIVLPFAIIMWALCFAGLYLLGEWIVQKIRKGGAE